MRSWLPWLIIGVELISPVPGLLTIGAVYVLVARPPWFLDYVIGLYDRSQDAA